MTVIRPCSCSRRWCQPLCEQCCSLADLVPRIRRQLRQYARLYGCLLTRHDLDDLTQEVLFGVARSGCPQDQLHGLVACVARRRLIDRIRHQALRCGSEYLSDRIQEERGRPVLSDLALGVIEAMDRMSAKVRAVFVARGIDGRTRREVADFFGLSEGTIQRLYTRGIAVVAEVLGIEATENKYSRSAQNATPPDSPC